ncbi:MAG: MoaD/ThiS family protein [Actinomycetales bacterium]|nr:MoaD/ThiS family protein [Actinomycetales bacterium]
MTVTVRFFAGARQAAGTASEETELPDGARVTDLVRTLAAAHGPALARVLASSSFLVDEVGGSPERVIPSGAVVDVLPPFSGG